MHPVWLVALGLVGAFLAYVATCGAYHQRDWREVAPCALAAAALLAAVAADALGALS